MRQLLPVLASAALLVLPAAAAAAPTPGATYSGGLLDRFVTGSGKRIMASAEVGPDGQTVKVVARALYHCDRRRGGNQLLVAEGRLGADGRLRLKAPTRHYEYRLALSRPRGRATVDLGFEGAAGSGTIRFAVRLRGRRCAATIPVELRVAGPDASPPAPVTPGAIFYGSSDALFRGVRTPILLRVRPDGTKVGLTYFGAPLACDGPRVSPYTDYLDNVTPPMRIAPDGAFSEDERFSFGRNRKNTTVVRLRGRFTAQGAAGTYSVTQRDKSGIRCKTGTVAWTAIR